jgi:hypothetical protein
MSVLRHPSVRLRSSGRVRSLLSDRVSVTLLLVFLPIAAFYLWTAGTSFPLTFDGGQLDRYNLLATALLHLHLSIGPAPAGLMHVANPYDPAQNKYFTTGLTDATSINDDVLYGGRLFFLWGPAPAIVLLIPLHLLGLEPSGSITVGFFAIVGLGFALGTLRVILRQVGDVALWMCVLAGSALALSSAVPFLLRTPSVTEDTISGGFCFTMAGIWLAAGAVANGRASPRRLALMSLCFGLAAGSRPTLTLTALVMVPVYVSLRSTDTRRRLLIALITPLACCLLLLAAYNQARFGNPLEFGVRHQLTGYDSQTAHLAELSYVPPGAWFYTLMPPRPLALFPFIALTPPPVIYPAKLPADYLNPEMTGGLLPMAPILIFLVALPWIWRRRPELLGPLAWPLTILAGTGIATLLFVSYEFFATTERYEVDFSTLLLLGALATWLALSHGARGGLRRLVRFGGGMLAAWGCIAGIAISFVGYGNYLAINYPATWTSLENLGSPLSTAIAGIAGRPILADTATPNIVADSAEDYTDLGGGAASFYLASSEYVGITIVSPDTRTAALTGEISPGIEPYVGAGIQPGGGASAVVIRGPGHALAAYRVPLGGRKFRFPVKLSPGVDHVEFRLLPRAVSLYRRLYPAGRPLLLVNDLLLADRY